MASIRNHESLNIAGTPSYHHPFINVSEVRITI